MASKTKAKGKRKAKTKAVKTAADFPPEVLVRIFNRRPLDEVVGLTDHAIDRYRERFRPGFSPARAKVELQKRMRREGRFITEQPRWIGRQINLTGAPRPEAIGYVTIDEDLALPVIDANRRVNRFIAPTCLYHYSP